MKLLNVFLFTAVFFQFNAISQTENIIFDADNCIDGQDLYAEDIDVSNCPIIPNSPASSFLGDTNTSINLGAWELGQTAEGESYKYGSLSTPVNGERTLSFSGGSSVVNEANLECWAKGYYRLRKILQNPPAAYVTLHSANFQVRFFQFQTDLRNGSTGFKQISSYMDHLVKWVTVIDQDGTCIQPTLGRFETYLENELVRRAL
jgi:hypothetical protein